MGDIIQLNQEEIKGQLKELVRGTWYGGGNAEQITG